MYGDPVKEKRFHMRVSGEVLAEIDKILKEAAKLAQPTVSKSMSSGYDHWWREKIPSKTDLVMFALMKTFPRGALKNVDKLFKKTWSGSHENKIKHLEKISQACNGKKKKEAKKKTSRKKK